MDYKQLMEEARRARENAHAPYSHFSVGAAVLCGSGRIYGGCNVENSSYGATICAERAALCHAIAHGEKEFLAIAIQGGEDTCYPCGICRQVLHDFNPQMDVVCMDGQGGWEVHKVKELLPHVFTL